MRHAQTKLAQCSIRNRGFTLIELMVTVAIIGIIAMIAYPSYSKQLIKGRRASAQSYLMDIAQREQQYLLDKRSYTPTESTLGLTTPNDVSPYYTISITVPATAPPAFTATATPKVGSAQASDVPLSITDANVKLPAGYW